MFDLKAMTMRALESELAKPEEERNELDIREYRKILGQIEKGKDIIRMKGKLKELENQGLGALPPSTFQLDKIKRALKEASKS